MLVVFGQTVSNRPDPRPERNKFVSTGHSLPEHTEVIASPILGELHHEYRLAATPRDSTGMRRH